MPPSMIGAIRTEVQEEGRRRRPPVLEAAIAEEADALVWPSDAQALATDGTVIGKEVCPC